MFNKPVRLDGFKLEVIKPPSGKPMGLIEIFIKLITTPVVMFINTLVNLSFYIPKVNFEETTLESLCAVRPQRGKTQVTLHKLFKKPMVVQLLY